MRLIRHGGQVIIAKGGFIVTLPAGQAGICHCVKVVSAVDVLPGNCINGILPACVLYPAFEVVNGGTPSREVTVPPQANSLLW